MKNLSERLEELALLYRMEYASADPAWEDSFLHQLNLLRKEVDSGKVHSSANLKKLKASLKERGSEEVLLRRYHVRRLASLATDETALRGAASLLAMSVQH